MGRRGPRNDVDVPTMLLDTAERLFGPQSMHEVSLRAVAREAGVAPSRVGRLLRGVIAQQAKKGAAKRRPRSMRALRLTSPWAWAGGLVSSANQLVKQSPGLLIVVDLDKRCSVSPPIASHGVHNLRFPHKSHGGWRLVCLTKHFISYDVGSR